MHTHFIFHFGMQKTVIKMYFTQSVEGSYVNELLQMSREYFVTISAYPLQICTYPQISVAWHFVAIALTMEF